MISRIKVLFIVPTLSVGGAERVVATSLPAMDPDRFDVSLLCTGAEGEFFGALARAGVEATALGRGGARNAPRALWGLYAHLRRARPDVVVVYGDGTSVLGRIAAYLARIRHRVVWVHRLRELDSEGIPVAGKLRSLSHRSVRGLGTSYLGVTAAQRDFMVSTCGYPEGRIHFIRNGVDPAGFDPGDDRAPLAEFGIESGSQVVAIVARLHPVKDHPTLLDAAKRVLAELPGTQFLIVGDGPAALDLKSAVARLGIAESVHFTGTRPDVPRLLRAVDVFVLSSVSECLPVAVLEAMACGRPVVCTDVGGVHEMVEHGVTGYLTAPRDPADLAARVVELLREPELARAMGAAGRRRVESDFTLEGSVAAMQGFLTELVDSRRHTGEVGSAQR